jgi:hypothetical protein
MEQSVAIVVVYCWLGMEFHGRNSAGILRPEFYGRNSAGIPALLPSPSNWSVRGLLDLVGHCTVHVCVSYLHILTKHPPPIELQNGVDFTRSRGGACR